MTKVRVAAHVLTWIILALSLILKSPALAAVGVLLGLVAITLSLVKLRPSLRRFFASFCVARGEVWLERAIRIAPNDDALREAIAQRTADIVGDPNDKGPGASENAHGAQHRGQGST